MVARIFRQNASSNQKYLLQRKLKLLKVSQWTVLVLSKLMKMSKVSKSRCRPNGPWHEKVKPHLQHQQERVKTRIFPNVAIQAACHSPPLTAGIGLEPFEWNPCKDGPHGCRNSLLVTGFLVIGFFAGILAIIGVFLLKFSLRGVTFFPKFQIHQFQLNSTKFDQIRPNFTRKSRSHIYNTATERVNTRIFPNVQIQATCHSPPLTTGIRLEPFEWNPCKDLYTWVSELLTRNWVFGNWVFCWYFSNNWGVSSEIFTPGGAFF